MDVQNLRERLINYIQKADIGSLSEIYVFVEDGCGETLSKSVYDDATMAMLNERREKHRKGISKSYTAAEAIDLIKLQA